MKLPDMKIDFCPPLTCLDTTLLLFEGPNSNQSFRQIFFFKLSLSESWDISLNLCSKSCLGCELMLKKPIISRNTRRDRAYVKKSHVYFRKLLCGGKINASHVRVSQIQTSQHKVRLLPQCPAKDQEK